MLFFVNRFTKLHRNLGQGSCLFLHRFGIATFDGGLGFRNSRFDFTLQRGVNFVTMFYKLLLGGVDKAFGVVLGFCRFTTLFIFFGKGFGIADHLVNIRI